MVMVEKKNLSRYVAAFQNLDVDENKNLYTAGKAPHKPVLLLSVISLYKEDKINLKDIEVNHHLKKKWVEFWDCLKYEETSPVHKPLYHLKTEDFWNIEISQDEEPETVVSLRKFFDIIEKIWLDEELIELFDCEDSCVTLIDAILTGGYFSKEEKDKLASKMNQIDHSSSSNENVKDSTEKRSVLKTNSKERKPNAQVGNGVFQDHIEKAFDEDEIEIREILDLLDTGNDRSRLKLILALELRQNSEILQDKRFKDKIIELLLKEDDELVKENIRSLIHGAYDNQTYFINKFLVLLNDEDPQIRSNVAESLKIFDDKKVNKHLIDKLYDEEIEVRMSALKTLFMNDDYDPAKIEKALEDWKTSLQIPGETEKDELEMEVEDTTKESLMEEKEDIDESLSWKKAVKEAIRRFIERKDEPTFSRQNLIDEEMDYIKKATGTEGKTPEQTLSRVLQELWKEENFISHEEKGVYKLYEGEVEGKKREEEKQLKEKEDLLTEISEERIDIKDVEDEITNYVEDSNFLEMLINSLDELDSKGKYQLIDAISETEEDIVLNILVELLEDPNEWVREKSAETLSEFSKEAVIPKVSNVLKNSENERSRKYATEILGEFDDKKALEYLDLALEDESAPVRKEALNSIDKIDHEEVKDILKKARKSNFSDVKKEAKNMIKRKNLDENHEDDHEDENDEGDLGKLFQ